VFIYIGAVRRKRWDVKHMTRTDIEETRQFHSLMLSKLESGSVPSPAYVRVLLGMSATIRPHTQ